MPSSNLRETLKTAPFIGPLGKSLARVYRKNMRTAADWWSQGIRYPALVDVRMSWPEYEARLAKEGKYYSRRSFRLNLDCEYDIVEKLDMALLGRFAAIWDGFYRLPPDFIETLVETYQRGWLRIRVARLQGEIISLQYMEQYGSYALCLPPFYDKDAHRLRSLGSYMWFKLVQQATSDPTIDFLDFGGGPVVNMPPDAYKLRYNPQDFGYRIKTCLTCGYMWPFMRLNEALRCKNCGKRVWVWHYAARFKYPASEW